MQSNSSSSSTDSGFHIQASSSVKKFIEAYQNGCNVAVMRDALKELLKDGDVQVYSSKTYAQLLNCFEKILASAADTKQVKGVVPLVLEYLIVTCKSSEKIRISLRDDYEIMPHLCTLFNPHDNNVHAEYVLECIELLSRGLLTTWKAPHLTAIINKCYTFLITVGARNTKGKAYEHVLQLLINICRKNSSCLMIVRQNKDFNTVWEFIRNQLTGGDDDTGATTLLETHLLYLLEPTIPIDNFLPGFDCVSRELNDVLRAWADCTGEVLDGLTEALRKIGQLLESILDKMKPICESIAEQAETVSSEDYKVFDITKAILQEKLNGILDIVKMDFTWNKYFINELLHFVMIAFPDYLQRMVTSDFYVIAFEIVDKIIVRSVDDMKTFTTCIQVFHHLTQHLSIMDSPKKQDLKLTLVATLKRIQIVNEDTPEALERNIACFRMLSCLGGLHATSDMVARKLEPEVLENILESLSRDDSTSSKQLNQSICVVELLNLLSQYSKHPAIINLIMKSISSPDTYSHISNCIINAPEEIVERALHITASIGIYGKKTSSGVAKALMIKRAQPSFVQSPAYPEPYQLSSNAVIGAARLDQTLRSLGNLVEMERAQIHPVDSGMIGDIFAWYRLNKEVHEHEIANLNEHVHQQNKTIAHLKNLLERQTEFVSTRLNFKEEKEVQILTVQHKLDKATRELKAISTQSTTEIEHLKEKLRVKSDSLKKVSDKLKSLETTYEELRVQSKEALKERASLTEKVKTLRAENKEMTTEHAKVKKELHESKQMVSKFEIENRKKEEERVAVSAMLDEKTKLLETIQGFLGARNLK